MSKIPKIEIFLHQQCPDTWSSFSESQRLVLSTAIMLYSEFVREVTLKEAAINAKAYAKIWNPPFPGEQQYIGEVDKQSILALENSDELKIE